MLHVKASAGKFISFNLETEKVVNEVQTSLIQISNLSKVDGHFLFSRRIVLPANQPTTVNNINVGYIVNDETYQVTDTFQLPIDELDIYDISNLNRLNKGTHIRLYTYLVPIADDAYVLGVQGNSTVFYFSEGELSDKVELDTGNTGKIEVVRKEAYGYGLRIPELINNVYHVNHDGNTVQFSSDLKIIGNDPQIISVSHSDGDLSVDYERLEGVDHLSFRLKMYKLSSGYVMHDRAVNMSSYLYLFQ